MRHMREATLVFDPRISHPLYKKHKVDKVNVIRVLSSERLTDEESCLFENKAKIIFPDHFLEIVRFNEQTVYLAFNFSDDAILDKSFQSLLVNFHGWLKLARIEDFVLA